MSACEHMDFVVETEVFRLHDHGDSDSPSSFTIKVWVRCVDCDASFGFKGPPAGFSFSEPRCSVDALTVELPLMSPTELELAGPLPAARRGPMVYECPPASPQQEGDGRA
jgi:hypothetical protein